MSGAVEMASLFRDVIRDLGRIDPAKATVLDFGCGRGSLVDQLVDVGLDAYGCDIDPYWQGERPRLREIQRSPYRIPFSDDSIDAVVSTSVLEHVRNTRECFYEIKRVLKPGGISVHLYPGKRYLPREPHILVPLVNILWPRQPRWWLALWAILGVRNEFQQGMDWRAVTDANERFSASGIFYPPQQFYVDASMEVFGNCEWPMLYFLSKAGGGAGAMHRRLPLKRFTASLFQHTRNAFLVQRKTA
jgi:SAM-dependent methyltransferase